MNMIHSVQKETKSKRELSCYSFARNQRNRHRSAKDRQIYCYLKAKIENKQEFEQFTD